MHALPERLAQVSDGRVMEVFVGRKVRRLDFPLLGYTEEELENDEGKTVFCLTFSLFSILDFKHLFIYLRFF